LAGAVVLEHEANKTKTQKVSSMKTIVKSSCAVVALVVLGSLGPSSARADQTIGMSCQMPVHVTCNVNEIGCNNSPGPQITIDGAITLGGLSANLIFENNAKGTHTDVVTTWATNIALVPLNTPIVIPKQPVLGGVGGNPYIYLQFFDSKGNALTDEMLLGRCVQGFSLGADFLNEVIGATTVSAAGCDNHPGPVITMGGQIVLSGLKARIIFRNNAKGTHSAQTYTDVDIIVDGTAITIPKSPSQGGAGGNPLILLQFLPGNGTPITDPIMLGRCNQI
jgi:hypothetical protein